MLNLFVWSEALGDWRYWCRCRPQNLWQLQQAADGAGIDFYWTGF